jgi:ribosomal protein L32E
MEAKRGRLSSIDLLPEEAHPHIREAIEALNKRDRPQDDIREELNGHLLALGLGPVSRSAFNRKSLSLAKVGEKIRQAREMAAVFAEKLDDMPEGDVGMLINETIKVLIYELTQDIASLDVSVSAKMLKELSLALHRTEMAGNVSVKRRQQIEQRAQTKASEVVDAVAKSRGLSAETVEDIKSKILGVKAT